MPITQEQNTYNVGSYPWCCEHVVDEVTLSVAPVVRHFSDLVSDYVVVAVNQCVHVAVQALQEVYCADFKFNFDKIVWVGYKVK